MHQQEQQPTPHTPSIQPLAPCYGDGRVPTTANASLARDLVSSKRVHVGDVRRILVHRRHTCFGLPVANLASPSWSRMVPCGPIQVQFTQVSQIYQLLGHSKHAPYQHQRQVWDCVRCENKPYCQLEALSVPSYYHGVDHSTMGHVSRLNLRMVLSKRMCFPRGWVCGNLHPPRILWQVQKDVGNANASNTDCQDCTSHIDVLWRSPPSLASK